MGKAVEGVTPVYEIEFGICTTGRPDDVKTATYDVVKDAEGLDVSIDGNVEEWNPMDQGGWVRRLLTSKSIGISFTGKRNYGDKGNDYIASLMLALGQDCYSALKITFPNKDALYMPCVVNVTGVGGDGNTVGGLNWDAQSDGKPTYVPASEAASLE